MPQLRVDPMNRKDLKTLESILDKRTRFPDGPSVFFMLEALVTDAKLELDARDITAGKLLEITIKRGTTKDPEELQILARPVGDHFAIHEEPGFGGWTVTHRPSAMFASNGRKGARIAAAIATALQRIPGMDWTKAEPLKGADQAALKTCNELSRATSLACIAAAMNGEST